MMTNSTGNTYRSRPVLKMIACSTTPSPIGGRGDARKLSMRPSTTAASAHEHGHAERAPDREVGDAGPQEDRDEARAPS